MTKKIWVLCLLLGVLVIPWFKTWAGSPGSLQTVLITPFRFYAAQDIAYLNYGILEMLSTRLLRSRTIRVKELTKSPVDQAAAVELAQKEEVDYILVGGITIFDDRVSTDARLIAADSGTAVLLFSRFGRRPGDVLEHMDLLAAEMAMYFGDPDKP